jgi:hypothetical protein
METAVAVIPVGQEWIDIKNMSSVLVKSGFLPKSVDTAEKACAIMLMGRELGVGPMEAFSQINVIQGKPTQSAQMMKARVHQKLPKAIFRPLKTTNEVATFEAARPGDPVKEYSFSIKDAERMGIANKDNWKKQPEVMLEWRCVAKVARLVFPDCLSGVSYTPEELGANVNDEGEVIDVVSKPTPTPGKETREIYTDTDAQKMILIKEADEVGISDVKDINTLRKQLIAQKVPMAMLKDGIAEFMTNS